MMKHCLFFLLLLPLACFAQVKISGTITGTIDNKPIPNASVFLGNATIGTKTGDDGSFALNSVKPGQYDLVVSAVGFEAYHKTLMVKAEDLKLGNIALDVKVIELKEITVKVDRDRYKDMATFISDFLGSSEMAKQCIIINPDILNIDYDDDTHNLSATSPDFLEIDNQALGYHIKYLLKKFTRNNKEEMVYFEGTALFTEMDGTPTQKRLWVKRRKEVYEGSMVHFLRSAITNRVTEEGFKVLSLNKLYNLDYKPLGTEPQYVLSVGNKPLSLTDYISTTNEKGLYALAFKGNIYVQYLKKKTAFGEVSLGRKTPTRRTQYPGTALKLNAAYGFFDSNGIVTNPADVIIDGYWGDSRIAELLPVDYEPEPVAN